MNHDAPCILLVEDDISLRDSLCQFLEDHGYRTVTAAGARAGWELIRKQQPRLCLLDLNLPDGSGLDLLKKIAQHGFTTRVVVMTAFDLHHARPPGNVEALAGWLTKPVNPAELLKVVEQVMQEQGGQRIAAHQRQ